ncbi:SDR family oxidoreductase [Serratia proteamaculans]|uniref:SDR family oxidoreductase n=1 Tax=Serratia proteamaculans TaxID=28151 RepID=A0A7U0N4H2_SERPR|nr:MULTISPECIES: SDR family oxidoreductase [Serratia]MBO1503316.1 SDR family oxidoreductase [Serratia proteamaculans]MDW5510580.1 SDR family oxidoreductase [Serratia proteamaculans]QQX52237.1 SDR family oxidoreductase [Serratia proteamaculans]WEO87975.1 SDR family oxidoreductase [Serratia proteamaculans]CAI2487267.1 Gluconate 5-dehydrogenase [Serratia proteamaculans]
MSALFDLTGKTALVTGSSRGLGFSYAEGLAAAGASVILNGTQPATVQAAVERLQSQGLQARGFAFDVTDEQAIEAVFNQLDEERVEVDIVINNAGIQYRSPLLNLELEQWQRVLDTNLTSAFIVGRAAARRMIARGKGGKIINIGSLTSQAARATVAPYTAAKGGIKMLTCSMAAEWAEFNIQSNAIGPGYILTDMNAALVDNPEFDAWVKASNPSKRWGKPEELIGTAVYLASNASNYVNGQIIYVDGGWLAVL